MSRSKKLLHDETGQDMIEYGLLAALLSIVALLTVRAIGPIVNNLYQTILNGISP